MKMFYPLVLYLTWILGHWGLSIAHDSCRGNKQILVIPQGYDKDVPDSFQTENITDVEFDFTINRLRDVDEER